MNAPQLSPLDQIDERTKEIHADLEAASRYTADVRQKVGGALSDIWSPSLHY